MLATFLFSKSASHRPVGLRIYVILINALGLIQTVIVILQGFDMLGVIPPRETVSVRIEVETPTHRAKYS